MAREDLMIIFDDNTMTIYKSYDGKRVELASFIIENDDCLSDSGFVEAVKTIIAGNELEESHACVVLSNSLFYSETKIMPRLPYLVLYKLIKEELNCLFTAKRMKNYALKMVGKKNKGKTTIITLLLTPKNFIKELKIFMKKLPNAMYEINYPDGLGLTPAKREAE